MNRKISLLIMALVLGAILVPCINADTQSINSKKIKTIDRPWENIKSTSYEGNRTLKIKIMRILMEDFIDVGDGILNWYADFKWHIHVDDEKQSGRGPLDQHDIDYWDECDAYKFTFKYDVAQKDEVTIRIELWDRDLILDEECDINGETKEK